MNKQTPSLDELCAAIVSETVEMTKGKKFAKANPIDAKYSSPAVRKAKAAIIQAVEAIIGEDSKHVPISIGGDYDRYRDRLKAEQRQRLTEWANTR